VVYLTYKREYRFTEEENLSTDPYIAGTNKRGGHRPRTKTYRPRTTHKRRRKAETKKKKTSSLDRSRSRSKDHEPRNVDAGPLSKKDHHHHHGDHDRGRLATLGDTRSKNRRKRRKRRKLHKPWTVDRGS